MKFVIATLLLGVLIGPGCTSNKERPRSVIDVCSSRMSGLPAACQVSPTHLLVAAEALENREIGVVLFYPGHGAKVLFTGQEAAEANDLASALLIDDSYKGDGGVRREILSEPGYYKVQGVFRRIEPLIIGEGVVPPAIVAGAFINFREVRRIRTLTSMERECRNERCTIEYMGGVEPMPRLAPHLVPEH